MEKLIKKNKINIINFSDLNVAILRVHAVLPNQVLNLIYQHTLILFLQHSLKALWLLTF